ncbi:hypothetical protein IEQ11_07385 [Lysobacter capsici]|uniref:hypothetical protein n=1 Tax=Lysobacter capsici TaxID=435897 RepID=UPI0017865CB9|nr:hypothetical protein [Lysobacter capsici]UOF16464.1 hypothetical protein IEQ11_07385 [Lysobacter capsici]
MSARAILALLMVALLAAIAFGAAYQQSRIAAAQRDTDDAKARYAVATVERDTARIERDAARANVRIVTQYVDRVQTVHLTGATITKEIPVYVTAKADAACVVPAGFVRIHDAAAANTAPDASAGDPDAPAAGLTLSAVADTVAGNYTTCHTIREQMIGLQDYINSLPTSESP